jgi:hypothetical protein
MPELLALARRLPPLAGHLGYRTVKGAAVLPWAARRDRRAYLALPAAEPPRWRDAFPKVTARVLSTPFDAEELADQRYACGIYHLTRPAG